MKLIFSVTLVVLVIVGMFAMIHEDYAHAAADFSFVCCMLLFEQRDKS